MISAQGLSKSFGDHRVLDNIDFSVAPGERVAIMGLNGAGKTTLFRCLLGLTSFDGRFKVGGCDAASDGRGVRAQVGYVPQRAPHFDGTVGDVVDFFCRLRGVSQAGVEEHLTATGMSLSEHEDKAVRELSGGMLQKVLLGLALASEVSVLLLDEPTANLDPKARREFIRTLKRVPSKTTVLLASHRLADIKALADRVLVLHEGRFVFDGRLAQLEQRLGDEVTLWVKVPDDSQSRVRDAVASSSRHADIVATNGAMGLRLSRRSGAEMLGQLRARGVAVEDFWVEAPSLEDQLEHVLRSAGEQDSNQGWGVR